ncbi:MAG: methionine gamma-lyase family protein [Oscillospiraceae bacterium]|nr:methionine gamma-lyase family protein [Oscillospiraceae bacterium]
MNGIFDFPQNLIDLANKAENDANGEFGRIDTILESCTQRVLRSFVKNRVSEACLVGSTGYGYGDMGRDVIDNVFADAFECEDALVRHNFVSGTHSLSTALFGVLRPGDVMVSVTGEPYDTLGEVIGIRGNQGDGSLKDFGVKYDQIELLPDGSLDIQAIRKAAVSAKMIYVQRSRGYSLRKSISCEEIGELVKAVKAVNPDVIVMVDNCYGEFVEEHEPTFYGADLMAGSLIKNAGGGIARTGGYIAGRKDLVELCSYRLTCIGMGKEVGCTLGENREMLLGFFYAPQTVANAVKSAVFASRLFTLMGYDCIPDSNEIRSDIITAIKLGNAELLCAFCKGIQFGSPVDSFVTPEPWDMPGYDSKVIMAAGAFTGGASIELSADAPLREPFAVWMQGGLTYHSAKLGIMNAANEVLKLTNGK